MSYSLTDYSLTDYSLTKDEQISLLLSEFIPIPYIRYKILNYMNQFENKEALEYHNERYETISFKYFRSFERSPFTKNIHCYSYILSSEKCFAIKDRCLEFYNETGISFQVRNLLMDILKCPVTQSDTILNCSLYEWRKDDDKLYCILAEEIMKTF